MPLLVFQNKSCCLSKHSKLYAWILLKTCITSSFLKKSTMNYSLSKIPLGCNFYGASRNVEVRFFRCDKCVVKSIYLVWCTQIVYSQIVNGLMINVAISLIFRGGPQGKKSCFMKVIFVRGSYSGSWKNTTANENETRQRVQKLCFKIVSQFNKIKLSRMCFLSILTMKCSLFGVWNQYRMLLEE